MTRTIPSMSRSRASSSRTTALNSSWTSENWNGWMTTTTPTTTDHPITNYWTMDHPTTDHRITNYRTTDHPITGHPIITNCRTMSRQIGDLEVQGDRTSRCWI